MINIFLCIHHYSSCLSSFASRAALNLDIFFGFSSGSGCDFFFSCTDGNGSSSSTTCIWKAVSFATCSTPIVFYYLIGIFRFKCISTHCCYNVILLSMITACHLKIQVNKMNCIRNFYMYVPHVDPCQPLLVPSQQLRFLVPAQHLS